MAKEKRKCKNVSKGLEMDKKKKEYKKKEECEKHKCTSGILQIQSCCNKENQLRCVYGGT